MSKNGKNGHDAPKARGKKIRVASSASATRLVARPGLHHYHNAKAGDFVPGLMHVNLGGYHISDIEFSAASTSTRTRSARTFRGDLPGPNNTIKFQEVPRMGVTVERGMTHDGLGKYLCRSSRRPPARPRTSSASSARPRPTSWSPTCRSAARRRRSGTSSRPSGGLGVHQRHPGVHRSRAVLAAPVRGRGPAGHRRRHQEPGRRDDHPSRADPPVRGPRRADRPHIPAQLRRQHRLPQHARARAARVEEDRKTNAVTSMSIAIDRDDIQSALATTCRGSRTAGGATSASRARRSGTSR